MKKGITHLITIWIILLIIIPGCLAVYLIMSGIREASEDKIIGGMICGAVALFWLIVEGESHGA